MLHYFHRPLDTSGRWPAGPIAGQVGTYAARLSKSRLEFRSGGVNGTLVLLELAPKSYRPSRIVMAYPLFNQTVSQVENADRAAGK